MTNRMALKMEGAWRPDWFTRETLHRRRVAVKDGGLAVVANDWIADLLSVRSKVDVRRVIDQTSLAEGSIREPVRT